ncbi:glycoside hydrolase family 2 TIM barrel-domain containing protein [Luteolibacter soli]|uniref:Glycoside hydrolase family 2 TIM barrel-domain containing protein n=1 Tax=Luteolibacter soli TaxID=3135280 RepID=A0ABU9APQ4_9BACT
MLRVSPIPSLGFLAAILSSGVFAREIVPFDDAWQFHQGEAAGAEKEGFSGNGWETVSVPHDWSIAGAFDKSAPATGSGAWLPSGVAWYRKEFPLDAKGKQVWVEFDGVMANAEVWINGHSLGKRPSGYVSFRYDLTPHLKAKNVLVVKADTTPQPASRWYAGAGIYRHVRLVVAEPVHVAPGGVFVSTPKVDAGEATVKIETKVANAGAKDSRVNVRSTVMNPDGSPLGFVAFDVSVAAGKEEDVSQQLALSPPKLWDLDHPNLYQLVTTISIDGKAVDEVKTAFGIRSAEFTTDRGFVLNGKPVKMKGVCLHQDGGAVGAAVPLAVWERRLKKLRELGVNSIRTAHTPPSPEFLDLCDRMGFLVMDEFFDCWLKGKNKQDYHLYFKEWSHTDLRDGVLRDRNHPSVVLYSVGNEIHDTPQADVAIPILKGLVEVCHAADPSRPVTQALFRPNVSKDFTNGLADLLDVIGVNYRDGELLQAWKDKPGRKIIGTEQGHDRSTWFDCRDNPQHAGQFLWTGIDYLGESKTWPVTTYNSGLLDRAGFTQPRGVERQSWWSDKPMVGVFRRIAATEDTPADPGYESVEWKRRQVLFSDWTPADQKAHDENVEVYTNASEVELVLNDKSLGKKPVRKDVALNWKVPFEPGTLKAVASNGGKEVATNVLRTAGKPAKVLLKADREGLSQAWERMVSVEVFVTDANGVVVPSAANKISFKVEGAGKVVAVDNGSIVSLEPFQASTREAFQGRALVMLQGTQEQGKAVLKASAEGLQAGEVVFQWKQ